MPRNTRTDQTDDEDDGAAAKADAERLAAVEDERSAEYEKVTAKTPEPGPEVIEGPFGTTVRSTDQRLGTLRVEIKSNVTLGNELFVVGQKVKVVDDAETRGAIAVGHVRLLEDDEKLDSE